jgi:hypothetical protein
MGPYADIVLRFLYISFIYLVPVLAVFKAYFFLFYSLKKIYYVIITPKIEPFNYYSLN